LRASLLGRHKMELVHMLVHKQVLVLGNRSYPLMHAA
jgi:hypothetical protein